MFIQEFKTVKSKGLFVKVPDDIKTPKISLWSDGSTTLEFFSKGFKMGYDSVSVDTKTGKETSHKEITLHIDKKLEYNILGFSHKLNVTQIQSMGIQFDEYLKILSDNNLVYNYSKNTGKWLVLVEC